SPQIGGVLIRGERGTAKSTAARALAALLPEIDVVDGCPFNCDPDSVETLCDNCRTRLATEKNLPRVKRRTQFVDLPVSATEDRVVGTLDIEQAIKKGEKHFEPGVLAAANRGLLYVDEVNLLDDHVVDLLLDSAAMGINVVEREGISFTHPARFILVGTMNPEEGELRPQLLDRFALCVDIKTILDPVQRVEIVRRRIAYERDPAAFYKAWQAQEEALSQRIVRAQHLLPQVTYTDNDLFAIAELTAEFGVDGHRADIVILKAALAHAAFEGRLAINEADILLAAELALPHRLNKRPLQETELQFEQLEQRLEMVRTDPCSDTTSQAPSDGVKKNAPEDYSAEGDTNSGVGVPLKGHRADGLPLAYIRQADMPVEIGQAFRPRRLETSLDHMIRRGYGKRSFTKASRKRGRYVSSCDAKGQFVDIAFDATVRQAAPHQIHRPREGTALVVERQDLRRKVRIRRAANLILFVVDASWSMAAAERMKATKGAILSLLLDAYQKRDQVGLITFQKEGAQLVLQPTASVERARKALQDIPVGGKTPLSAGLLLAHQVLARERRKNPEVMPLLILLTDGAGNVSLSGLPPFEEALRIAGLIKQCGIRAVVINMEHEALDRGLAQQLADKMGAPCYTLRELGAQELYYTVRDELRS
ncbi:MAG: magnesium chelatase subunit D family protein, partial [Anaerolineae bacterium]